MRVLFYHFASVRAKQDKAHKAEPTSTLMSVLLEGTEKRGITPMERIDFFNEIRGRRRKDLFITTARKTGLRVKPNVKKDVDGFDSIEDFWDSGGDENGGDTSQPSDREHQRVHLARRLSQEIYKPSSAISGGYSSSDLSTLPSPFLYRPSNDRRRTSAIPLRKSTTGSTLWDDSSIERARFNEGTYNLLISQSVLSTGPHV